MALIYVDGTLRSLDGWDREEPDVAELQEMAEEQDWDLPEPEEQPWTAADEDALEEWEHRRRQRLAEASEY